MTPDTFSLGCSTSRNFTSLHKCCRRKAFCRRSRPLGFLEQRLQVCDWPQSPAECLLLQPRGRKHSVWCRDGAWCGREGPHRALGVAPTLRAPTISRLTEWMRALCFHPQLYPCAGTQGVAGCRARSGPSTRHARCSTHRGHAMGTRARLDNGVATCPRQGKSGAVAPAMSGVQSLTLLCHAGAGTSFSSAFRQRVRCAWRAALSTPLCRAHAQQVLRTL